MPGRKGRLILILGDQLSPGMSSLRDADRAADTILMAEVGEEARYVPHHRKKIAFIFAAMRHFAQDLRRDGWRVRYVRFDDDLNAGSFRGEVARAVAELDPAAIRVTWPGEWRLAEEFSGWTERFRRPVELPEDDRFICSRDDFAAWARGRKLFRMEHFYREMRRRTGLLMDGDDPVGGRWNLDAENRKPPPDGLVIPKPPSFAPDAITEDVLDLVGRRFPDGFGDLRPFAWPVTRRDAEAALADFLEHRLPSFGDYQDAMLSGEPFLFHGLLSPCINTGLLDPLDICRRVEAAYRAGRVPLNAAEGFIRQILGWREYVRGIYWLKMPGYAELNALGADRPLPDFYWTGRTQMACVAAVVRQTRAEAYAHHIQRLMITGNLALLLGVRPAEIHEWYLSVYIDAFEWVELPNTLGMSQYADGGMLGSKPYAAGGNYVRRMSDYCRGCMFDVRARTGPSACPMNYLYWDFLARNRGRIGGNPRLSNMYRTLDRMDARVRATIAADAARFRAAPR